MSVFYIKRPIKVQAFKYGFEEIPEWMYGKTWFIKNNSMSDAPLMICTLEGDMIANKGDYIIKGIQEEIYPCKPDIFESSYEVEQQL